ncbi:hypothetical protein [Paraburkholderia sp. C35]|uniref:hypothetical protein n=1 Tax=Paraburkholderia sp. C35 TaxID=2126993 RepID=UPI000D6877C8|nr:hypothetical protein [Paraburkholderia sp. C35]
MQITFLPKIVVALSADEWELYNHPGRDEAAQTLNQAASDALTQAWALMNGLHPVALNEAHAYALNGWEKRADAVDGFGATDTEPRSVMAGLARDYLVESPAGALDRLARRTARGHV